MKLRLCAKQISSQCVGWAKRSVPTIDERNGMMVGTALRAFAHPTDCLHFVIASEAKQSIARLAETWIASLRSQ